MDDQHAELNIRADQNLIAAEVPSQRILEIAIQAPEAAPNLDRPKLNLALVLDRSGSMSGAKLDYVKRAANHVLDLLGDADQVALVAYDDEINLLAPSIPVTNENRKDLKRKISLLEAGASTNLGGGWLAGCQEVAAGISTDTINRTLLLTDGLANVGIVDLEELAQHAKELCKRGVATSTFGVGDGFNEHLLEAMANQGGGNFYYIASPTAIPELFQAEFKELASIVARDVAIEIKIPDHVNVQVPGGWRIEQVDQTLKIFIGSLTSRQLVNIYLKLLTPPADSSSSLKFAVDLQAVGVNSDHYSVTGEYSFGYVNKSQAAECPKDLQLLERYAVVDLAEIANEALKLERIGKNERAGQLLQEAVQANAPYLPSAQLDQFSDMAQRMQRGMAERDRKQSHYATYSQKKGKNKP